MPIGSFVIVLPLDKDYKVLGYYFKEGKSDFEISNDLFLRLNLDHSKDEYSLLKLKENARDAGEKILPEVGMSYLINIFKFYFYESPDIPSAIWS